MQASLGLKGLHTSVFNICYRLSHHMQFLVDQSKNTWASTIISGYLWPTCNINNRLWKCVDFRYLELSLCLQIIRVKLKIEKVCHTFLKKWTLRRDKCSEGRIVTNSHSLFRKEPRLPNLEHQHALWSHLKEPPHGFCFHS